MAEAQQPDERDVDAIFESIVARWEDEALDPQQGPTEPDDEGGAPPPHRHGPTNPAPRGRGATNPPPSRRSATNPPWGARHPEAEEEGKGDVSPFAHDGSVPWRVDPTNSVADLLGQPEHPGTAEDDEGFTPPPTRPLPPLSDRLFWGALVGLVLGPLGLVWLVFLRPEAGFLTKVVVFGLIVGGFTCLVLRQPTHRGDDPDDGARV